MLASGILTASTPGVSEAVGAADPRTLIVSLDGVGYDVVQEARQRGAFTGWPETRPLISTFPSMTNVAFAAIYTPFGMQPIQGYELRYFDRQRNEVVGGGPAKYAERAYAWRDYYQVITRTNMSAAGYYFHPRQKIKSTMQEIEVLVLESPLEVMVTHFGATDVLAHMRGNARVVEVIVELAPRFDALRQAHLARYGRPLRIVLLSDHGNTWEKVRFVGGIRDHLRDAGLTVRDHLAGPEDVVAPTYGVVSYGAVYTDPSNAETAARAVIRHEGIHLAAWLTGASELRIVADEGEATIRWHDAPRGIRYCYLPSSGDPLHLAEVEQRLRAAQRVDDEGCVESDDWVEFSALSDFPDAPRRLVNSLVGTFVENAATVIFSFEQGYSWGHNLARLGAQLYGGKLEGTHGGLDRESTLGFYLSSDATRKSQVAVRADQALVDLADDYARSTGGRQELLSRLIATHGCFLDDPAFFAAPPPVD